MNGYKEVVKKLSSLRNEGLAISIISLAELYEGVYYSTRPVENEKELNNFLTGVSILGINEEICKAFGKKSGRLRKQGISVSDFDLLIASTCSYYKLTLLTNNLKHFKMIKELDIFSLS
ncbi:MAG: hypothetical protein A2Z58_03185 [Planctomycetes bacterium RIFCSPHIGHO2_12_42_15]|nr:MAG: hypothetical protein A2Z58_03185 [Planctomycetes bacterium RIFCSPHIGHO2_12_42_15]